MLKTWEDYKMENQDNNVIETNENPAEENKDTTSKVFTAEEVQALIQSESDKRVSQALKKQSKEYEKKLSLSSLDEQQRKEAEAQMKIQELQEQLASFQKEKNKSELKSVLSSRGLSAEFADIISISEDIEASQANIDKLDNLFKMAVRTEVEKRLGSNSPKKNTNNEITQDDAKKMSLDELSALEKSNPELFKKYFE